MRRAICNCFSVACTFIQAAGQSPPRSELAWRLHENAAQFAYFDDGHNLLTQARADHKDVTRGIVAYVDFALCGAACPPDDDANHWWVKQVVAEGDLVATGRITSQVSALTKGQGFVFTDSEFVIEEVWAGAGASLRTGSEVTIATVGGSVTLDGLTMTATVNNAAFS